jgi:hypothetical protein
MTLNLDPNIADTPEVRRAAALVHLRVAMDLLHDERRSCTFCGEDFTLTVDAIAWFLIKFRNSDALPRRCKACRRAHHQETRS